MGGRSAKKIDFFGKSSSKFSNNLSISLVQNISVLDKSRKFASCIRVDYEDKAKMRLNPSIQFFIDARGLLLIERKGLHYAQLKFTYVLNRTLFSYPNYPQKHADVIKTFFC